MASKSKQDEFNVTESEIQAVAKALENEEFRKLFAEYAEEISNPENRRKYEEEISLLEKERGMNVQFIHPEPGYVIKTTENGDCKIFINICRNKLIGKPSAKKEVKPDGKNGLGWSIPHSFSPPRDDVDKTGKKCKVYDFVIHPDTFRMTETNSRFRKIVNDIAMEGIENQFSVQLDKKNSSFPKLKYKGTPHATIIRTKDADVKKKEMDPNDPLSHLPYPYDDLSTEEKSLLQQEGAKIKSAQSKPTTKTKITAGLNTNANEDDFTVPKYSIVHRSEKDMQDFVNSAVLHACKSVRPSHLIITIDLPLLQSADTINLDIFQKEIKLQCMQPAKYKLQISLPYDIDENNSSAKFDKSKRKLVLTLPVIPEKTVLIEDITRPFVEEAIEYGPDVETDNKAVNNSNDINALSSETDSKICKNVPSTIMLSANNSNIPPLCPDFRYFQDHETVTVILDVTNVLQESMQVSYMKESNLFSLKFFMAGAGCFPMTNSIVLKFAENCQIVSGDMSCVSLSADNIVLVFKKTSSSAILWNSVWIGVDCDHLEEKKFLTDESLSNSLMELDSEISESKSVSAPNWSVDVTEMNENKFSFKMQQNVKDTSAPGQNEISLPVTDRTSTEQINSVSETKTQKCSSKKHVHFEMDVGNTNSVANSSLVSDKLTLDCNSCSPTRVIATKQMLVTSDNTTSKTNFLEPNGLAHTRLLPELIEQNDDTDEQFLAAANSGEGEMTESLEITASNNHVKLQDTSNQKLLVEEISTNKRQSEIQSIQNKTALQTTTSEFAPSTMLSWEDGSKVDEHKTKCSFEFTNSSIFDLDVD